ncbi:MAG: RHS repeat protein [Planctomycetota bacterium]|nr:MAG: RHS repeat protein [Planctomycetota bacterium]REK21690.1 MAG: RHS repeat protein [Planctomycetota bacterium]
MAVFDFSHALECSEAVMGSLKKTISYRYDAVRNRVGMTDPDGARFTYSYDSVNRITEVVNPQGDRTTYGYDPAGRRTVKKLANGTRASFSYDAAGNLTRLANLKSDGTTISSFNYDYDKVGNRTVVLEADGSRVTWSYDATYQLTGEHRTGSTPYRDTYTYDPAGNRLLKIHDGARTSYGYDAVRFDLRNWLWHVFFSHSRTWSECETSPTTTLAI